ncbi:choice-of-anchor G family protein [Leucobacter sp. HY1908]
MTVSNVASADEQTPPTGAVSAAHGHGLFLDVLGLDLAGTASAHSAFDSSDATWTDSDSAQLEVALLGMPINLGTVTLPLLKDPANPAGGGLLDLGDLNALIGTADSPSETTSIATSGIAGAGGSAVILNPGQVDPTFRPAQLDASALIAQVLGQGTADAVLDTANVTIGAVGAKAEKSNNVTSDEYMVAGLRAEVHSLLVEELVQTLQGTVNDIVDPVVELAGPGGGLEAALQGLVDVVDALPLVEAEIGAASIDLSGLATAIDTELLSNPLENVDQTVSIDLNDGMITLDLAKLVVENHPTATSLSELDPNTEVLSGDVVNAILDGVSDALIGAGPNSAISKVVSVVTDGLYAAEVNLDLSVTLGLSTGIPGVGTIDVAGGPIEISTTVGGLLGQTGYAAPVIDVSGVAVLPGLPCVLGVCVSDLVNIGALLQPVVDTLTPLIADIGSTVLEPVVNGVIGNLQPGLMAIVQPLVARLLDDALEPVLSELLAITINEQPTELATPEPGDLGSGSFTVRALSVTLLPLLNDAVKLDLASATVEAANAQANLTATPGQVAEGETVTLEGAAFTPGETVSFAVNGITDASITATVAADGTFTATWVVPAGYDDGDIVEFVATTGADDRAEASVTVVEATLSSNNSIQGGYITINGGGFVPGEDVTLENPDGTTSTVTALADGTVSFTWLVPEAYAPGSVTFTATGGTSGRTATSESNVTRATATLTSTPVVEPGETVTITGSNFAPGEGVTLTLPASCAVTSGTPVIADTNGAFTVTCAVNASVADGTALNFSAVGNDSGRSATSTTDVMEEPPAGTNTNASASAAASAQADGNNNAAVEGAAVAAARADASAAASAAADATANAAAESAAHTTASTNASTNATTTSNAAAQAAATNSTNASANASAAGSIVGSVDSRAASQAAAEAASDSDASGTASSQASTNVNANANASASAAASANASASQQAQAQAAAQAAAYSQATSQASASSNADATAAAEAAAYTSVDANASMTASADTTTNANSAAQAAARSTADTNATATAAASASADQNADSDAASNNDADHDSAAAAQAAARNAADANAAADPSGEASAQAAASVNANANASASASASADADDRSNASAQTAAQAAAMADNSSAANAAADPNAKAAAQAAARPNVQATATADAAQNAESSALAAATTTANASAAQDADASAAASVNAEASAQAAAQADSSSNASSNAAADVNAAASASASAQADSKANAAAQAAAETSAMADASTQATSQASAAATANAEAAAQAASQVAARADVVADASQNASQDTSTTANAAANTAAQASANHDATANTATAAQAQAQASANASSAANAAAETAANADSSATAAASASASATGTAQADPNGSADADPKGSADADPKGSASADPKGSADADPKGSASADPKGSASADPKGSAAASTKGGASQAASEGAADTSGAKRLAETGTMHNALWGMGALLLLAGAGVTTVLASRRLKEKRLS